MKIKRLLQSWIRPLKKDRLFPGKKWVRVYDPRGYYVNIFGGKYYLKMK